MMLEANRADISFYLSELLCQLMLLYPEEFKADMSIANSSLSMFLQSLLSEWEESEFVQNFLIVLYCGFVDSFQDWSLQYLPVFSEIILTGLKSEDTDMVQAAAYCVGKIAVNCSEVAKPFCEKALPVLKANLEDDRLKDDQSARDNVVAAFVRFAQSEKYDISKEELLNFLFQYLPMHSDEEEASFVYGCFTALVEELDVSAEQKGSAAKLLAEAFGNSLIEKKCNGLELMQNFVGHYGTEEDKATVTTAILA